MADISRYQWNPKFKRRPGDQEVRNIQSLAQSLKPHTFGGRQSCSGSRKCYHVCLIEQRINVAPTFPRRLTKVQLVG